MLDFFKLATDHRIPTLSSGHHHCSEGHIQTHCPFCARGSGWHLGWHLTKGYFSCWRCGKLITTDVLARLVPGVPVRDLFRQYGGKRQGIVLKAPTRKPGQSTKIEYPPNTGPLLKAHRAYLRLRRFDATDLEARWGLRGVGACGGAWAWRILAPICDHEGRVVSYTGRAIGKAVEPRYKSLELSKSIMNPKAVLYGEHLVPGDSVIVVEGPADAWRIGPGAVALLGVSWSTEQAARLRYFKRITFLSDNDEAGRKGIQRFVNWLSSSDSQIEVVDGLETDPGDLDDKTVKEIRHEFL